MTKLNFLNMKLKVIPFSLSSTGSILYMSICWEDTYQVKTFYSMTTKKITVEKHYELTKKYEKQFHNIPNYCFSNNISWAWEAYCAIK
jgi:hypothetical protein